MAQHDPLGVMQSPSLTKSEATQKAGLELETATRIWRALGLPEIPDDEVYFDELDVEAMKALRELFDAGVDPDDLVMGARLSGQFLARLADLETRIFRQRVIEPMEAQGLNEEEIAERMEE